MKSFKTNLLPSSHACFLNNLFVPFVFLAVVECKVDSLIGLVGIMIRETAETFGIITQDNNFRGTSYIFQNFWAMGRGGGCFWKRQKILDDAN